VKAVPAITPLGRVAAAGELKGAATFPASEASDYVAGQTMVTDEGARAK